MHVFLSYARSSEPQAQAVERTLTDEGYAVWRDSELPAHLSYAEVIEERLNSAKAVLVLWSAEAAKSQWVRAEADAARERGTLVQSSVDGTVPPIPFNQIQCADLKGWTGEGDHAGWRKLHASIVALAGQAEVSPKSKAKARKAASICVLPFQNKSPDDVPDYFCEGLSEDITTDLGKAGGIAVTPLRKALAFKGQDAEPSEVAEKLGVAYVLLGAVLKAGSKVRITTQLIDGATGEPTWSDRYHRDFSDILSIQDEITQEIVAALKTQLIQPEADADEEEVAKPAKAKDAPPKARQNGSASAFKFDSRESEEEQEVEAQAASVSLWDKNFNDENETAVEEEWSEPQEYYSSDDDEDRSRGFNLGDLGPRLIGGGLVALLAAVLIYFFYWPSQPKEAPVVAEKEISYTVTVPVNVRSLPSRYNSRILGTLEKGATINIVPDLAGAQPDWLKIKDGPYVGGYVWRESTRPVIEGSTPATKDAKPRKDATG